MRDAFFPDRDLPSETVEAGKVARKIRARGGSLMMVEVSFEKGGEGRSHAHPHEQVTYCLEGEFEFSIDGQTRTLRPGDSVYIAGDLPHGVLCGAKGRLLDVFSPQREDFLPRKEKP